MTFRVLQNIFGNFPRVSFDDPKAGRNRQTPAVHTQCDYVWSSALRKLLSSLVANLVNHSYSEPARKVYFVRKEILGEKVPHVLCEFLCGVGGSEQHS